MGIAVFVIVECHLLSLPAKFFAFLSYFEKVG